MRLVQNALGISKFILILLLLISAIVGGVLSYMWTEGYYQSRGFQILEAATVTITNVAFDSQDPTFFDLTLLNPSISPSSANIAQIMVSTEDGVLHDITTVTPPLPVKLSISESKTLKGIWNWTSYSDENVDILVFLAEGSGATYQTTTPFVDLTIIDVVFNSTISVSHFNVTVQNSASSVTDFDVAGITVTVDGTTEEITVTNLELPYTLNPNSTVTFMGSWNWTPSQGKTVVVTVRTLQELEISTSTKIPEVVCPPTGEVRDFFLTAWVAAFNYTEPSGNNPTLSANVCENISITILGKDSKHNIAIYAPGTPIGDMYLGSPSAIVRSADVTPGQTASITWTPTATGTYIYVCEYHVSTMRGDLVVTLQ